MLRRELPDRGENRDPGVATEAKLTAWMFGVGAAGETTGQSPGAVHTEVCLLSQDIVT